MLSWYTLKAMEVDGIVSELRYAEGGERSITKRAMFSLIRDAKAHVNGLADDCPFCSESEVIVIE